MEGQMAYLFSVHRECQFDIAGEHRLADWLPVWARGLVAKTVVYNIPVGFTGRERLVLKPLIYSAKNFIHHARSASYTPLGV